MNNATRLKRLYMLKEMLENHKKIFPEYNFNMKHWVKIKFTPHLNHPCKTAACALGSACVYPPFCKMGLKHEQSASGSDISPAYRGSGGYSAGEDFFGLESNSDGIGETYWLFDPDKYAAHKITPSMVASRVGVLIKKYQKVKTA